MKKYILKYKLLNLIHIILIGFSSAFLVGASVTLSIMLNKLVESDFKGFLIWLGIEFGVYLLFLADTYLNKTVGEHLSILNNDIKIIEESGFESFYSLVSTVFTTFFSIIALFSYDYRIVLLSILLTLILTYLPRSFAHKMEKAMKRFSIGNETFISSLTDQLLGYDTLYYSNKKEMLSIKCGEVIKKFIFEKIVFIKTSSLIEIIMSLFSIISQMLVLLLTGYLIILKQVSIGSISSVGQISGNIFNSLTTFNQLQVSISSVNIKFEKFGAFEKSSHYRYIDKDIEEIKLTNVGYSFKDKEIFKNINCSFEKGKNYAIVGESGSGKSTLINIILGNNKQYSGSVKYNDVEISDIEESQLFKSVSYIGNITHIYHDSLRNNLTLWDNKINESEIINILKQVNLIDLIPRLDDEVSMSFLSEGQKQRLGIARAYLTKTNVIIMDESMANLDRDNAFLIENQLLNDPTRMYITVSHHLQEKLLDRFHSIITL